MVMEPSPHCCCCHIEKRAIVFLGCFFVAIKKVCICLTEYTVACPNSRQFDLCPRCPSTSHDIRRVYAKPMRRPASSR